MMRPILICLLLATAPVIAQRPPDAGEGEAPHEDLRRVRWIRPLAEALRTAQTERRAVLVKPIMGGSNTPDPKGVPCGGKRDCEGSW